MNYDQHDLRANVRTRMAGCEDQPTPQIVKQYAASHDLTKGTVSWLKLIVIRFGKFLGREATDSDFAPESVNAWLTRQLSEGKLARTTIKSYRRGLLILWRWLSEEDRAPVPAKVKRVKAPWPVPVAFTADEVALLVRAASELSGYYPTSGVPRGAFFAALIQAAWDTGLRPCDLFLLRVADLNPDGRGAIVQHKVGRTVYIALRPSTLAAIEATYPERRPFIFGGVASRKSFFKGMRKLVKSAGLSGGIYKIRKGAASALECESPGFASRFLGHSTPGLAERHYFDPRIVNADRRMPPALPPALDALESEAAHA